MTRTITSSIQNSIPPALAMVLKEMCKRVGANYEAIDFKKNGWYQEYEWTRAEEEDFVRWFEEYLKNDKKARQEIMKRPSASLVKGTVQEFMFMYGWKNRAE